MILMTKCAVFGALVVVLAVNAAAWRRYDTLQGTRNAMHDPGLTTCQLDPGWQCANTKKWEACWGIPSCLIAEGVAI